MLPRASLTVLVLVVAASALGQPQLTAGARETPPADGKPAGPLTDAAFFNALNLELPALAGVREAVNREDWPAARQAYYAYLCEKLSSAKYVPPPELADSKELAANGDGDACDAVTLLALIQKPDLGADAAIDAMKTLLDAQRLLLGRVPMVTGARRQILGANGVALAAIFHEFKEAPQWFQAFQQSLLAGSTEIMPDGSTSSLTPAGTDEYLRWLAVLPGILTAFKAPFTLDIPPDAARRFLAAIDWQIALRMPDGYSAPFDTDRSQFAPAHYGNLAMSVFPNLDRPDLLWFATEGREGIIPLYTSFPIMSVTPSKNYSQTFPTKPLSCSMN